MAGYLAEASGELKRASGLALEWASENAQTAEAGEIRIAAAEVVDLFQQVVMRRAAVVGPLVFEPELPPVLPWSGQQTLPADAPARLIPAALTDALAHAVQQLEELSPA